ncbi:MAG: hypothetical protein GEU75_00790 [Dehalococcoidia bacterium]|nr:hypothetical protein [Dehalococcoidia bacterium]
MRRGRGNPLLFALVLLSGIAAFGVLLYQTNHGEGGSEPAFGGIYVEGMAGTPARVNPLFAGQNSVDEALVALVFSGLTRLDTEGRAIRTSPKPGASARTASSTRSR